MVFGRLAGFCRKAKAALKDAGFAYEEIEASQQLSLLRKAKEVTGQQTVPQVGPKESHRIPVLCLKQKPRADRQKWHLEVLGS